jgi:hypothetical protein
LKKAHLISRRRVLVLAAAGAVGAFAFTKSGAQEKESAQDPLPPKQAFVRDLQRALRSDDRSWIADHMSYPVRYHGKMASVIRNRNDFMRSYARLVSERLRGAILAQQPDEVFENWQGLMIGDGTHNMWARDTASGDATRYEIVTINDSD